MPRNTPHLAVRILAGAAAPVLLVAGCSFGSDSGGSDGDPSPAAESSSEAAPSPEPVKFSKLPDACKTISKDTVEEVVPKAKSKSGKNLGSKDVDSYGSCLWNGLDDYDYRALTVSLRRFDSDTSIGSGDKRATEYAKQQLAKISEDKAHKGVKESAVKGVGDTATALSYEVEKKEGKSSEDYREQRLVVRTGNVVLTVDYSGAGFEDAKTPKAADIRKGAEKVAKEAVKSVK